MSVIMSNSYIAILKDQSSQYVSSEFKLQYIYYE